MTRNFWHMISDRWNHRLYVSVGLDSELKKIPASAIIMDNAGNCLKKDSLLNFNKKIIEATAEFVCAYKPNIAFYEAYGPDGLLALHETIKFINEFAPEVPVILDAKRADIGNTNIGYAEMAFDYLGADAITVNPYFGEKSLQPFLNYKNKGIFVLCRTSNPGADELQDLLVTIDAIEYKRLKSLSLESEDNLINYDGYGHFTTLCMYLAYRISNYWNKYNNCALVVGATNPKELADVRKISGDMPILIPGIGAQGGDLKSAVLAGVNRFQDGIIINSSRGIIFASQNDDFALAAEHELRKLNNEINEIIHILR